MPSERENAARQVPPENSDFHDERDSLLGVVISLIGFAAAEYFVEVNIDSLPGGLVFPLGFILFWAFYYTYYRPNNLENRLRPLSEMSFPNLFEVVFGVIVWFMKVTVVGAFDLLFVRWWKKPVAPKAKRAQPKTHSTGEKKEHTGSYSYRPRPEGFAGSAGGGAQATGPSIPSDLATALHILGIEEKAPTWDVIHKRYRELAKKLHPDLNKDITQGHRFIRLDQAYRKLSAGKGTLFK